MNKLIFEVNEKEFYESKKAVNLGEVEVDEIVVSGKIKFLFVTWMILVVLLHLYALFYHK